MPLALFVAFFATSVASATDCGCNRAPVTKCRMVKRLALEKVTCTKEVTRLRLKCVTDECGCTRMKLCKETCEKEVTRFKLSVKCCEKCRTTCARKRCCDADAEEEAEAPAPTPAGWYCLTQFTKIRTLKATWFQVAFLFSFKQKFRWLALVRTISVLWWISHLFLEFRISLYLESSVDSYPWEKQSRE